MAFLLPNNDVVTYPILSGYYLRFGSAARETRGNRELQPFSQPGERYSYISVTHPLVFPRWKMGMAGEA
jgi:hypothetical protein